jgi:hypothetical protein
MEVDGWVLLQPTIAFHEAEELDTAPALGMLGNDLSGGDVGRGKQRRGAMPLVIMALAGQGASVRELQIALRPLQRLDRRLLIDAENHRLGRRVDIKTDHVGRFGRERRIIALAPGLARRQIDMVLAQKPPNILNINVLQCFASQQTRPARVARGRWLFQKRQNPPVRHPAVDRLLAPPRAILQSNNSMIGKAMPPFADNARLNAYFLGDRTCARPAAASNTICARFTSPCGVLGARQRASSTLRIFGLSRTSLASGIIPILNHDSPQRKGGTLMFVVNLSEHGDVFSVFVAELYDIDVLRSAGGRDTETTVGRL